MDDTLTCPICGNKLRNIKKAGLLHTIGKHGHFVERICTKGMNHRGLQFFVDEKTKQVDLLKLPLNAQYSRHIEIDFYNQRCRIIFTQNNETDELLINRLLIPDFPAIEKLRETVGLYLTFS